MHARRRTTIVGIKAIGIALALTFTGCSSPDPTGTGDPTANATESAIAASGGALVIGVTSDPDTLFPWKATQFQAVNLLQNIYGTLTEFDADLNVVPGLAESWEASDDGLTMTLALRDGVTFADGSDFDSADVKFSLEAIMDEATAAVAATSLVSVSGIETPDPSTVVLTLSAPDAALPANLAVVNMAMLSSDDTEEALNTQPNGTGAFTFESRTPSQSITLARSDTYWGDAAKLDTVVAQGMLTLGTAAGYLSAFVGDPAAFIELSARFSSAVYVPPTEAAVVEYTAKIKTLYPETKRGLITFGASVNGKRVFGKCTALVQFA